MNESPPPSAAAARPPDLLDPFLRAAARHGGALVAVGLSLAVLGIIEAVFAFAAPAGEGARRWLALAALPAAAGAMAGTVAGVWPDLREAAVRPRRVFGRIGSRLRRSPVRAAGRLLLLALLGVSLVGALAMPYEYALRFAGGESAAEDGLAAAIARFARGFPAAAFATYCAGFWALRMFADSRPRRMAEWYRGLTRRRPAEAALLSYGVLALLGGWLLVHPFCQRDVLVAHPLWALFVSVSALTTTGLAPVDITVQWNGVGHGVILLLVIAGGLGIFLFWAMLSTAARRLRTAGLGTPEMEDAAPLSAYFRRTVVFFFASIGAGALLLFLLDPFGAGWGERAFASIFHSASAFCNAGFALTGTVGSFGSLPYGLVMSVLVVLGGLGPAVVLFPRSRHSRVAVGVSLALVAGGAFLFRFFDRGNPGNGWGLSLLQSVSARTAGFGWVDVARLPDVAAVFLMVLMLIGAAPGGNGGGVKVTVFYTATRAFRAIGKGADADDPGLRRDALECMEAFVVLLFFGALTCGGFFLLASWEEVPGIPLLFEAVSAVTTTGLSMDVTPALSAPSLLVLLVLMLAGKVGPFLVLLAVFSGRLDADDFLDRIREGRVLTA